jgi:hypothetical protein
LNSLTQLRCSFAKSNYYYNRKLRRLRFVLRARRRSPQAQRHLMRKKATSREEQRTHWMQSSDGPSI